MPTAASPRRVSFWGEVENDGLAPQRGERDGLSVLVREGESGATVPRSTGPPVRREASCPRAVSASHRYGRGLALRDENARVMQVLGLPRQYRRRLPSHLFGTDNNRLKRRTIAASHKATGQGVQRPAMGTAARRSLRETALLVGSAPAVVWVRLGTRQPRALSAGSVDAADLPPPRQSRVIRKRRFANATLPSGCPGSRSSSVAPRCAM